MSLSYQQATDNSLHLPTPGFNDPVRDAQKCFRAVLLAISHPARLQSIHGILAKSPSPMTPACAAVCLTLLDTDTPVWIGKTLDTPEIRQFLSFHCGCPLRSRPSEAAFALMGVSEAPDVVEVLHTGTAEYPDRAATAIIQCRELGNSSIHNGDVLSLSGPGIQSTQPFAVDGSSRSFWQKRKTVNQEFPTGIDMIFVDAHQIAGLPRTTHVSVAQIS